MSRSVVITGLGVVSAIAQGVPAFWAALARGDVGTRRIRRFDPSAYPSHVGAEVLELPQVPSHLGPYRVAGRPFTCAVAAASEALKDAGLMANGAFHPRRALYFSGGCTDLLQEIVVATAAGLAAGPGPLAGVSNEDVSRALADGDAIADLDLYSETHLGAALAWLAGASQVHTLSSACAGGSQAIGDAAKAIGRGDADVALAGGGDSLITRQMIAGFCNLTALSRRNDQPEKASRPFDRQRDGFVMGEGAGFVVLEEEERARARGAVLYARLAGVGYSGDAYRLTDPRPDGSGMTLSMERALLSAGASPEDVGYINAHGTSTEANDLAETQAIKRVFGDHARKVPISSTKSMIGHLVHGAGAVETVASIQALYQGVLHATANYEDPDPACDLDYVPGAARQVVPPNVVLNNSFGFGGQNVTLALKRVG